MEERLKAIETAVNNHITEMAAKYATMATDISWVKVLMVGVLLAVISIHLKG